MTEPRPTTPTAPARRRRRRHPAAISRIVVAGAAATSTFGIVAAMGYAQRTEPTDSTPVGSPTVSVPVAFPDGPVTQAPVVSVPSAAPAPAPAPTVADRGVSRAPAPPVTAAPSRSSSGSRSAAS